ncbi:MAG: hypothetical protein AAF674_02140 [Pseudomonadota bacterium]
MAEHKKPETLPDDDLDQAQGGNLIDPWPVRVKADGAEGKAYANLETAHVRTSPPGRVPK